MFYFIFIYRKVKLLKLLWCPIKSSTISRWPRTKPLRHNNNNKYRLYSRLQHRPLPRQQQIHNRRDNSRYWWQRPGDNRYRAFHAWLATRFESRTFLSHTHVTEECNSAMSAVYGGYQHYTKLHYYYYVMLTQGYCCHSHYQESCHFFWISWMAHVSCPDDVLNARNGLNYGRKNIWCDVRLKTSIKISVLSQH